MRLYAALYFAAIAVAQAGAFDGVIVAKTAAPLPFYLSVGVDGSYKFLLRDRAGAIHSQLVTPEVFGAYRVGQYFNDLAAPPPLSGFGKDDPENATCSATPARPRSANHHSRHRIAAHAKHKRWHARLARA